jgi:CheY-like chemotaxis protein
MDPSSTNLPRLLVIDDVYGWSPGDRRTFCEITDTVEVGRDRPGSTGREPGGNRPAIAEILFVPGQKREGRGVRNDPAGAINAVKSGQKYPCRWAAILLDLQFNTGPADDHGIPTAAAGDEEHLFGLQILERIWADEGLRDIPIIILTQLKRETVEERIQQTCIKYNLVWEVVGKGDLDRQKIIGLLMDYALLEGSQVLELLAKMEPGGEGRAGEGEGPLIIGSALPLLKALRETRKLALHTDIDVMLRGETGVGKELFARLIHRCSRRRHKPFKAINCAAIPGELFEAELFGYMPGAFTGAGSKGKEGLLETVKDGTFFLDEVGDLSLDHQAKLLRVIQNREFFRIGGSDPIPLRARLIYATNKDLEEAVAANRFRADLNFRINFPPVVIPPLRERGPDDMKRLASHFVRVSAKKFGKEHLGLCLHPDGEAKLAAHHWQGNVRELEYVVMKAVYGKSIRVISPKDILLPGPSLPAGSLKDLFQTIKGYEFRDITGTDLDCTLRDLQRFIIHLLNAGVRSYLKENRPGRFVIDEERGLSLSLTGLMKRMTGLEHCSATTARRLFKSLCEMLPGDMARPYIEELAAADHVFRAITKKIGL